jgi:alpha-1,6-mannosyltransferase
LAPFTLLGAGLNVVLTSLGAPVAGEVVMEVVRYLGLALTAAVIGWLALGAGRTRPVTFLSWSYMVFAFGGIALNSWYLTWGGVLLPLTKPNPRIIGTAVSVTAVLLAYEAGNLAWRNDNGSASFVAMGLAGMAVVIVLLYRHQQAHRARTAGESVEG